ncbi:hypothetical protein C8Q74DRAFT_1312311 [Fomes fomentarius]|nr:hypothetical protein C8Q74DRAFT_1312311 [Fomes fomentarius]
MTGHPVTLTISTILRVVLAARTNITMNSRRAERPGSRHPPSAVLLSPTSSICRLATDRDGLGPLAESPLQVRVLFRGFVDFPALAGLRMECWLPRRGTWKVRQHPLRPDRLTAGVYLKLHIRRSSPVNLSSLCQFGGFEVQVWFDSVMMFDSYLMGIVCLLLRCQ